MKKILSLLAFALLTVGAVMAQNNGSATVGDEIYTVVEQKPQFPGGEDALLQWLGTHVQYPEKAKAEKLEGKVYVTFVVERDGSITNVRIVAPREKMALLEEEAVRVVRAMPKWEPGKVRGKKVRVQFNLPIVFYLQ
ncbi:MAG: energy transducer TonB [Bacteroidales bacterium]|nr:energy transducer TonB [Bacteroidales bacterium]